MPYIVGGKKFHQVNVPGPRLVAGHHQVLTPITVSVEAASEASALYKAEYRLAEVSGDAEEIICMECIFSSAKLGAACMLTGVPIKYLAAA
jgi:hypothetical protein